VKSRVVSATEFKAKCLALLDEIAEKGGTITVTKRGRPVATVGPALKLRRESLKGAWAGKVFIPDEVLMADHSDSYDCLRQEEAMSVDPSTSSR
jgi:prevent-host-death family protein